ncbi:MAG TPA: DUF3168 domain-containing protein, partial [Kaistia sp.]|nr:DUF3168 domain-containing protein [Kaistia sp.]
MTAALELQVAIVASLLADSDLAALVDDRIHDGAPRGLAFPSVTLGETRQADWSSDGEAGGEVSLTLHVWSRAIGKREAWATLGRLMRLLHDAPLVLDGPSLVLVRVTYAEVRLD